MAVIKAVSSKASIKQAIDYVTKEEKTEEKLMSGINCSPETALEEMQATKELWNKMDGRTYKHFTHSYPAGEDITPEQAHKNALELVEGTDAFKGFEVLVATHKDRKHIHSHFIVNSVSYEDGHKLQWSKADLVDLKKRCNEQSREQGLSVPEKGKTWDGQEREETTAWDKHKYWLLKQAEQQAGQENPTIKSYVFDAGLAVMECKEQATSKEDFIRLMKEHGYKTEWNDNKKHITYTDIARKEAGEKQCKVRNSNLEKTFNLPGKEELLNEFEKHLREAETERTAEEQLQRVNKPADADDNGATGRDYPVEVADRADEGAEKTAEILRNIETAERSRASAEAARRDKQSKRKNRDNERKRLDRERKQRTTYQKRNAAIEPHSR